MLRITHSEPRLFTVTMFFVCEASNIFPFQPLLLHPVSLSFSRRLPARNIKAGVKSITGPLNSCPFVPPHLIHGLKGPRAVP